MKETVKPLIKRFSSRYWKSQIGSAEERRKKFIEIGEESIRVYNAQKDVGLWRDLERRLNVWWYCNNTLMPAYFSSTPRAEVLLRKRSGSTVHEMAATILERNLQYQMDCGFDFYTVGYNSGLQFLLTGQGVTWARYAPKIETIFQEIALITAPDGRLVDIDGNPYDGDMSNSKKGPGGTYIVSMEVEAKTQEKAILDVVQYNDYLTSDGRNESEIEWRGRRAYLTRKQADELFGADITKDLSFDSYPESIKRDFNNDRDKYEGKAELYEIWSQEADKVFWVHKNSEKTVVQSSDVPIKFENFYPCAVITQSVDPDSVIPVSDYAHVKDQILEIERLTTRIHAVTQTIRTNAIYDSAIGNQVQELLAGDLKMIPAINWPSYKARGGLSNSIEFMPIEPYVNALQTLQAARQTALNQLYETLKVSDLLRGTSEQYKSATANRLESQWSSLGLIVRQNMFAKFISDSIANLGTIIATQFDEERIMNVADADQLLQPLIPVQPTPPPPPEMDPNMPPEQQQQMMMEYQASLPPPIDPGQMIAAMKQQIMQVLRDNTERNYRIQIASDSMVALDQAQDQQEGMALLQTCGEYFNQMNSLIQEYPPLLEFGMQLFQNMIKRFKGGKELDGIFMKAFAQIGEIAKAKEEAAKQPPPPDPVMQEVQGRLQIAQIEAQARIQATQMEMQDMHEKNLLAMQSQQLEAQRDQLDSQLKIQKQQFDEFVAQQELALKQQEVQIKGQSIAVDMAQVESGSANNNYKHAVNQESNRMEQILELQRLELEQMKIKLSESEKLLEERRLNSQQELERLQIAMQAMETRIATPVVKKKKKGIIISDAMGNPVAIEITEGE